MTETRAMTEGPGGPHRGSRAKLTNSTVNGSASDMSGENPKAGLACGRCPGKQGARRSGTKGTPRQKDIQWTVVGKYMNIYKGIN